MLVSRTSTRHNRVGNAGNGYSRSYVGAITYTLAFRPITYLTPFCFPIPYPLQPQSQHTRSISSPNFPPPRIQYTSRPSPYVTSTPYAPPPGSTVVRPWDPCIGGTMCYKPLGSGVMQFFIFEGEVVGYWECFKAWRKNRGEGRRNGVYSNRGS
jgi:hypothetical protein